MLDPTDGNLHALARYQREVDEADARDRAIEKVMEDNPEMTEEDALEFLKAEREAAEMDRGEYLAECRRGDW